MQNENDSDAINGVLLLVIGLIVALYIATHSATFNAVPANAIDRSNTYYQYETHTTNIDICGICINGR